MITNLNLWLDAYICGEPAYSPMDKYKNIMQIKKILGSVTQGHVNHSVAKLENGCYAVGHLTHGQTVRTDDQFKTLDAAFEHWVRTLIIGGDSLRVNTGHVLSGHTPIP